MLTQVLLSPCKPVRIMFTTLLRLNHPHHDSYTHVAISSKTFSPSNLLAVRNFRDFFTSGVSGTLTLKGAPFQILNALQVSQKNRTKFLRSFETSTAQPDYRELGHLVYKGRHRNTIQFLKTLYFLNIIPCLAWSSYNFWWYYSNSNLDLGYSVPMILNLSLMVAIPTAIHVLTRNIITEIFFNPTTKVFTASVIKITGSAATFSFTVNDVKAKELPLICPIIDYKRRNYFVTKSDFRSLDVYKYLFGVDK